MIRSFNPMNLFKRLFGSKPSPVPVQPEPLSCFVLGLIRSMKETPGDWKRSEWSGDPWWSHPSGITVTQWATSYWKGRVNVVGHEITDMERVTLKHAFETYLENPIQEALARKRAEREAKEAIERAAERAPFEALGCPPSNP